MKLLKNAPLNDWHTFRTGGMSDQVLIVDQADDPERLKEEYDKLPKPVLMVGQGSNILFRTPKVPAIIHNALQYTELVRDDQDFVILRVGGGVVWDDFVAYAVDHGWNGIENLSAIPGTVACSAVQNIGAYGAEAADVVYRVHAFDLQDGQDKWIEASECHYAYRQSIFKTTPRLFVLEVEFKLAKSEMVNLEYKAIREWFESNPEHTPTASGVRNAVLAIRGSKLPDPAVTGNAGSFFKNPVVSRETLKTLEFLYPDIVFFPIDDNQVKLAAAWLIDQAGWKGFRRGDAGVNPLQSLVLVNYGQASGEDIYRLAMDIRQDVYGKFSVLIEPEVVIV